LSQNLILGFVYIPRKFPFDPRLFPENEKVSIPPRVIGVYRFYKNWSTETFRKKESKSGLFSTPTLNAG
jgi:hypothetical protein